ncbi:MAG TPA: hypothetical protein DEG17_05890 [Cyanobacteria bacterium UBA11149]|nr:hypothetical protein [Cyanobacteria bacterium UBA11367]HBE58369.1 hypothetical protein [Cyanobacteria bacterium UBA11366]HBK62848.1 hypothetical protein [Cyanobacteria bacterium UBA11166]HBR73181.1 hypothetical protein [Cyanobacteria bacterium UBA11159]HBW88409.1 hypothetical protein [Cyanobacteria bacterium UBA11149]
MLQWSGNGHVRAYPETIVIRFDTNAKSTNGARQAKSLTPQRPYSKEEAEKEEKFGFKAAKIPTNEKKLTETEANDTTTQSPETETENPEKTELQLKSETEITQPTDSISESQSPGGEGVTESSENNNEETENTETEKTELQLKSETEITQPKDSISESQSPGGEGVNESSESNNQAKEKASESEKKKTVNPYYNLAQIPINPPVAPPSPIQRKFTSPELSDEYQQEESLRVNPVFNRLNWLREEGLAQTPQPEKTIQESGLQPQPETENAVDNAIQTKEIESPKPQVNQEKDNKIQLKLSTGEDREELESPENIEPIKRKQLADETNEDSQNKEKPTLSQPKDENNQTNLKSKKIPENNLDVNQDKQQPETPTLETKKLDETPSDSQRYKQQLQIPEATPESESLKPKKLDDTTPQVKSITDNGETNSNINNLTGKTPTAAPQSQAETQTASGVSPVIESAGAKGAMPLAGVAMAKSPEVAAPAAPARESGGGVPWEIAAQVKQIIDKLQGVLSAAGDVIWSIVKNPIGFLGNLVKGMRQGFESFVNNISIHLQSGLVGWLTGTLGQIGVQMPSDIFSIKGIFSLVAQVLGLSRNYIRTKAVKLFGKKTVFQMEQTVHIFQNIQSRPETIVEHVKEEFIQIKKTVIGTIKDLVINQVVQAGVKWILSLLNPVSGLVKAASAIYDIVMFFVNQGKQVVKLVNSVTAAVKEIAAGAVSKAASLVENALVRSIPVLIGFFASLLGIGGLAHKVQNIIEKIRTQFEQAIDKFLQKVKSLFKSNKSKDNEGEERQRNKEVSEKQQLVVPEQSRSFSMNGKTHTLYIYLQNGKCQVDIASRREHFENVIRRAILTLEEKYGRGSRTDPLPALKEFLKQLEEYQYDINLAASRASTEAEVINKMHKRLDRMAQQLAKMGNQYKISDLQEFKDDKRYTSGGELRLEYQKNIRETFYGSFNTASLNNKKKLLNKAKAVAKTKPGYNNIPANDRQHIYWCEDSGSPPHWLPHFADERNKNEKPEIDHIIEVSTHWKQKGYNQTQAQRQAWFNDTNNHQAICKSHNASKGGQTYRIDVGADFKGPGE